MSCRRRARRRAAALRHGTLCTVLAACGLAPAAAQVTPPAADTGTATGRATNAAPGGATTSAVPGAVTSPGASATVDAPYESLLLANRLAAPTAPRNFGIEGVIDAQVTGTDRGRLDQPSGKDLVFGVSPRLSVFSRGAQLRVNAMVGVDQVSYVKNTNDDYVQPLLNANVQAELVQNLLYIDGGASYDRRTSTPYTAQGGAEVPADEQVKTGILRFAPRLEHRSFSGWTALLRSDNVWTQRSGNGSNIAGQYDDSYSQNTEFRFDKEPQRFGGGLEGGHQSLKYDGASGEVLRIDSLRASAGLAASPQFTGWLLGGAERNTFAGVTETDPDYGVRLRWALLERSVITAEVRQRFFGTGYSFQWDHRHRQYSFTAMGAREPFTEPDSVQLSGNVAERFDAIFQSRGYDPAQREALVRAALAAYGLPDNLTDPVNVRVNRAQLNTVYNGMLSLLGRRTVVVLSAYYRKLIGLEREDDPVSSLAPGDLRQIGGRVSYSLQLSPLSTFEAFYRVDDTRGLGFDLGRNTRDDLVSVGTTHSLSPKLRVSLALQHHRLEQAVPGSSTTDASANSATLGLSYRF